MTNETTPTILIGNFLRELEDLNPGLDAGVLLVGSVARNAATSQSDLDLVVVSEGEPAIPRSANRIHVQSIRKEQFLAKLAAGDDFVAWCVRYGIPVRHSDVWEEIVRSDEAKIWPDWRQKIEHASRRLLLANDLLQLHDESAAAEELTYALSHTARALLLKEHHFPLSRPEMIRQLSEAGYEKLSILLQNFSFGSLRHYEMRQAVRYVKKLLVYLDRDRFYSYVLARKNARESKAARLSSRLAS